MKFVYYNIPIIITTYFSIHFTFNFLFILLYRLMYIIIIIMFIKFMVLAIQFERSKHKRRQGDEKHFHQQQ